MNFEDKRERERQRDGEHTNELLISAMGFESNSHIIIDIIDWKSDKVQITLWSNDSDYANAAATTNE